MNFADLHIARNKRYGVGEIGNGFFFVGLDVYNNCMPEPCIGCLSSRCILHETQHERFYVWTIE